jgi:hypothetical protein
MRKEANTPSISAKPKIRKQSVDTIRLTVKTAFHFYGTVLTSGTDFRGAIYGTGCKSYSTGLSESI